MKIPDNAIIQSIDLRVKDLNSSLRFYSDLLGFKIIDKDKVSANLSANGNSPYLIKLVEDKNAVTRQPGSAGLYHTAFKFKNRKELARVFMRLFKNNLKFQGFSDHLVSEAIYLADPDGNGVELYTDKPKEHWEWNLGQVQMDSLPLDLSLITSELDDPEVWNGIDEDTVIGHIHLNVNNLFKAEKFYSNILGFNVTNSSYNGAKFFSAGGYHHHIGTNIWNSSGKPFSENSTGLIKYSLKIPDTEFVKNIEKNAEEAGLLISENNSGKVIVRDYDGIISELII